MKQGIIFGIVLIVLSYFGVNVLYDKLYNDDVDLKIIQLFVGGEEIYSSPLDNYSTSVVWYVEDENGEQLILEDDEIIEYYALDISRSDLINPDLIDYELIESKSGEDAEFNMIYINEGVVSIYEANCRDRICVKTGEISNVNQQIACIPHQMVLKISGQGGKDA